MASRKYYYYSENDPLIKDYSNEPGKYDSLYDALEDFVEQVEFSTAVEDYGIGNYEYGSIRGFHSQKVHEIEQSDEGFCLITILVKEKDNDLEWFLDALNVSDIEYKTAVYTDEKEWNGEVVSGGEEVGEVASYIKRVVDINQEVYQDWYKITCKFEFSVRVLE